ncbi:MAG: nicotinamide-nucleotide adenylyltransferase [Thaumarchaeota archaeon]|nr:nicotinamide-nucleotide adenylyltransferase [Nitrososphaerota archaeon]
MKRGLFIGRFQPFHLGHLYAIKKVLDEVEELIIVVGSTQKSHEPANPFTVGERLLMLKNSLTEAGIDAKRYMIIPVPDALMHSIWVAQVVSYTPPFDTVYTNEALTRRLFQEAGFKVKPVSLYKRERYWATEVRERMLSGGEWNKLVPKAVAKVIRDVDGANRVKDLLKKDHNAGMSYS